MDSDPMDSDPMDSDRWDTHRKDYDPDEYYGLEAHPGGGGIGLTRYNSSR